jgi:hypothetical protein
MNLDIDLKNPGDAFDIDLAPITTDDQIWVLWITDE